MFFAIKKCPLGLCTLLTLGVFNLKFLICFSKSDLWLACFASQVAGLVLNEVHLCIDTGAKPSQIEARVVVISNMCQQGVAGCPRVCACPPERPACPPGVSLVPDSCGCCKVCASQLNQDCHEGRPCDHHKGLECNYGNDVGSTRGICRGESTKILIIG